MKRGSRASLVIKVAWPCGARPDERCTSGRYSSGRPGTFASEIGAGRAAAATSAR